MSRVDLEGMLTAALSDVGRVRSENQDACAELRLGEREHLLVVADGMGGHAGGRVASRLTVETVLRSFRDAPERGAGALRLAFEQANQEVRLAAEKNPELAGMGSTCVALVVGDRSFVAHVGDSRAYRLRGTRFDPLTRDHSAVADLVERGLITPEEASVHPRRNEILRSVGVEPAIAVDISELVVEPGDRYLLCSDGLSGVVSDTELAEVLGSRTPADAVRMLVDAANARGGPDNVTVVVGAVPGGSENRVTRAAPPRTPSPLTRRTRRLALALAVVAGLLAAALALFLLSGALDAR